jgi:hypothetical protein
MMWFSASPFASPCVRPRTPPAPGARERAPGAEPGGSAQLRLLDVGFGRPRHDDVSCRPSVRG